MTSSVNGQTRKRTKKRKRKKKGEGKIHRQSDKSETEWCLSHPRDLFNPMKPGYLLLAGGCSHVLCSSLHRNHIPILLHNWQRILLGFPLINCQGKGKTFSCVSDFQSDFLGLRLAIPRAFLTISRLAPTGIMWSGINPLPLKLG